MEYSSIIEVQANGADGSKYHSRLRLRGMQIRLREWISISHSL